MKRYFTRVLLLMVGLLIASCDLNQESSTAQKTSINGNTNDKKVGFHPESGETCTLKIGWDTWKPYMYLDADKKNTGLDADLINAIFEASGCQLEYSKDSWVNRLKRVEEGDLDVVPAATISDERRRYAFFSAPYRNESFVLYVRMNERHLFKSTIEEILLDGKKIGIRKDLEYGEDISELISNPRYKDAFITVDKNIDNYYKLINQSIDAFFEDPFAGLYIVEARGMKDQMTPLSIVVNSGEVHFMFSKQSVKYSTVERLNAGLLTIKNNGTYHAILKKYSKF